MNCDFLILAPALSPAGAGAECTKPLVIRESKLARLGVGIPAAWRRAACKCSKSNTNGRSVLNLHMIAYNGIEAFYLEPLSTQISVSDLGFQVKTKVKKTHYVTGLDITPSWRCLFEWRCFYSVRPWSPFPCDSEDSDSGKQKVQDGPGVYSAVSSYHGT